MRVAGFNLGSRFTLDDLSTASDIIHGNIRISLGGLDEEREQEIERERARMLDELEKVRKEVLGSGGGKEKGVEKVVENEVKTVQSNSSVKNNVTVEKYSSNEQQKTVVGINVSVREKSNDTVDKNSIITEQNDKHKETKIVEHVKRTVVKPSTTCVQKDSKPIRMTGNSGVKQVSSTQNVQQSNNINRQVIKSVENKREISKVSNEIHKEKEKVDYSELTLKEINSMYLRKFMINNGVKKGAVDASILVNEFGSELVRKLQSNGYIIKRGKGFIMGI